MTDNGNEHIKLAQRITDMLCQLNEGKALDTKQLAEQYAISTRTISKKIAQLGYVYDKKTRTYAFIGDDLKKVENTDFGHLFRQNIRIY